MKTTLHAPLGPTRGKPKTVHSDAKMHCVCLLMIILNHTYRDMQNLVPYLRLPWDEPVPDHSTIGKYLQDISGKWLEKMVADSTTMHRRVWMDKGNACSRQQLVWRPLDTRSTSNQTRIGANSPKKRVKRYLKWHVTSILDPKIILCARITSGRRADSPVLRTMLNKIKGLGMHLRGSVFCADRGYDADANCQIIFDMGMTPQIKQRKGATNRGKPYRKKVAELFDMEVYRYRGLVEGIFGAEETKGHRLHCRYTKRVCQLRFGQVEAIGWNLKVLNRIGCEAMTKNEVKSCVVAN